MNTFVINLLNNKLTDSSKATVTIKSTRQKGVYPYTLFYWTCICVRVSSLLPVCHQVSTTGQRPSPTTLWYHSHASVLMGSPTAHTEGTPPHYRVKHSFVPLFKWVFFQYFAHKGGLLFFMLSSVFNHWKGTVATCVCVHVISCHAVLCYGMLT